MTSEYEALRQTQANQRAFNDRIVDVLQEAAVTMESLSDRIRVIEEELAKRGVLRRVDDEGEEQ